MFLLGRRVEKLNLLPLDFENVVVKSVDVTNKIEFEQAIKNAEEVYGETYLLVNNAGLFF